MLPELDADLLQDRLGIALDDREPFLVEDLGQRDVPHDVRGPTTARLCRRAVRRASRPRRPSRARASCLLARRRGDQRPDPRDDVVDARARRLGVGVERDAHGGEMLRRGAAAAADDARAGIDREADIVGHQLGRAGVVDVAAVDHRHAAIRLGDDDRVGPRLGHAEHRDEEVGGADAAIAADRERAAGKRGRELGERGRARRPSSSCRRCRSSPWW